MSALISRPEWKEWVETYMPNFCIGGRRILAFISRLKWQIIAIVVPIISFTALTAALDYLRLRAGAAQDAITHLASVAYLGCFAACSAVAGCMARTMFQDRKWQGLILMGIILVLLAHFNFLGQWFDLALAMFRLKEVVNPAASLWAGTAGLLTGWMFRHNDPYHGLIIACAITFIALLGLWLAFYPLERYFIRLYG